MRERELLKDTTKDPCRAHLLTHQETKISKNLMLQSLKHKKPIPPVRKSIMKLSFMPRLLKLKCKLLFLRRKRITKLKFMPKKTWLKTRLNFLK